MSDPRLEVLADVESQAIYLEDGWERRVLAAIDAADRAAGIVRINLSDEELPVRVAEVIYTEMPRLRGVASVARAVIASLWKAAA